MLAPLGNPLIVTMGMGQEEATEPGMIAAGIIEYFKVVVRAIREALGDGAKDREFDEVDFFKLKILLTEINNSPLENPLYSKINKLIVDKRIKVDVELLSATTLKSEPLKIVITGTQVLRETDE